MRRCLPVWRTSSGELFTPRGVVIAIALGGVFNFASCAGASIYWYPWH